MDTHDPKLYTYHLEFDSDVDNAVDFVLRADIMVQIPKCGSVVLATEDVILVTTTLSEDQLVKCISKLATYHNNSNFHGSRSKLSEQMDKSSSSFLSTIKRWWRRFISWLKNLFNSEPS